MMVMSTHFCFSLFLLVQNWRYFQDGGSYLAHRSDSLFVSQLLEAVPNSSCRLCTVTFVTLTPALEIPPLFLVQPNSPQVGAHASLRSGSASIHPLARQDRPTVGFELGAAWASYVGT